MRNVRKTTDNLIGATLRSTFSTPSMAFSSREGEILQDIRSVRAALQFKISRVACVLIDVHLCTRPFCGVCRSYLKRDIHGTQSVVGGQRPYQMLDCKAQAAQSDVAVGSLTSRIVEGVNREEIRCFLDGAKK